MVTRPTNRCTRAAIACFSRCFISSTFPLIARPQLNRSTPLGLPDDAPAFDTNRFYCAAVFGACHILSVASRFARLQELGHANNRDDRLHTRYGATFCIERYLV